MMWFTARLPDACFRGLQGILVPRYFEELENTPFPAPSPQVLRPVACTPAIRFMLVGALPATSPLPPLFRRISCQLPTLTGATHAASERTL